ncbi:MAG: DUF4010 domain-containing protein [Planctomycetes bacterium]|nr:DUF4010 domain-containing protein [Planctomycetota bacterium]
MAWTGTTTELALGFGLSLAVGVLVGIERERHAVEEKRTAFAGIRTFPLISLTGALAGLLAGAFGAWALLPPLLALTLLLAVAYWYERKPEGHPHAGLTSEIAALLVFGISALPFLHQVGLSFEERAILAGALGAIVMALLSLKGPLHKLTEKISREDIYATVRFLLLAAVLLPLLPDKAYGRFEALNPFWIGVVTVLIAGISIVGYLAVRFLGARKGIGFTAFFGGLVSSTAVTLTFSAKGRENPRLGLICVFAVVFASTVMFPRIVVSLAVINEALVPPALLPLGAMLLVGLAGAGVALWRAGKAEKIEEQPKLSNPFQIGEALKLGLIFAAVRLVSSAAYQYFGETGLYASALLAGLTDVDAITISIARMHKLGEGLDTGSAVLAITLAAVSNTLTKTGIALALGGRRLGLAVAAALVPAAVVGLTLALLFS